MCFLLFACNHTDVVTIQKSLTLLKEKEAKTAPPWVPQNTDEVQWPASLNWGARTQPLCKHCHTQALLCLVVLRLLSKQPTSSHRLQVRSDHIRRGSKRGLEHHPINTVSSKLLVSPLPLTNSHRERKKRLMGSAWEGNGSCGSVYTALREGSLAGAWRCKYNRNPPLRGLKARMISF